MTFCTDIDLLYWEPDLFRSAAFASQLLLAGSGSLSGTTFTIDAGSLLEAHVAAGQAIVLGGAIDGCYPIVSVNSATELSLSVLYEGLDVLPGPVGSAAGLSFAIRTFWPQRKLVSDMLRLAAGVGAESGAPAEAAIANPEALRRPCALGTLHLIHSAMAAASSEPGRLAIRAELYERLYRRSLMRTRVQIDVNGDGLAERVRHLGLIEMARA